MSVFIDPANLILLEHLASEILDTEQALMALREDWERLFAISREATAFLSFAWNLACWQYREADRRPAIVVVREQGNVVGIGPFWVRRRLGTAEIELIGGERHVYAGLLIENERDDVVQAMASALVRAYPRGMLHLPYYGADNYTIGVLLNSLVSMGWKEACWQRNVSHFLYEEKGIDHFLAGKTGKVRNTLRHQQGKLEKSGEVAYPHITGEDFDDRVMERLGDLQRRSWLARRGQEELDSPFYRQVLPAMARAGQAEVFFLTIDGVDVAYNLNLCAPAHCSSFFVAFDERYQSLRPGTVLKMHCVKALLERGDKVFDYLFGEAEAKRFWSNRTRWVMRAVCWNGIGGWLLGWLPHRLHGTLARQRRLRHQVVWLCLQWNKMHYHSAKPTHGAEE